MSDRKTERPQDLFDWLCVKKEPDWRVARPLGSLLGVVLVIFVPILFLGSLVAAALVLMHTARLAWDGASEGINLGAGALIAALLGAPFLIWGTWLKYLTVRTQQEGHMTDRISKAVEQLGAEKTVKVRGKDAEGKEIAIEESRPNIEVRIGAILSLERIAQDSTRHDKGRDHVRVMEILCAYIRENSLARKPVDYPEPDWEPLREGATEEERKARENSRQERFGDNFFGSKARNWARSLPKPREDVALALKVIGRRSPEQRQVEAAWPDTPTKLTVWPFDEPCPSFSDKPGEPAPSASEFAAYQSELNAWKETLQTYQGYRPNLRGANLQGAVLSTSRPDSSDAVFAGAILVGVRMEGADFRGVRMEGTNLRSAIMEGAILSRARLEGADLSYARLEGADLWLAGMQGADLQGAQMEGANLWQADMKEAYLLGARMERANLSVAKMQGARLWAADLHGANLLGAHFDAETTWAGTVVSKASAQFVDLSPTAITFDQVNAMFGDASTILPPGMPRPAHWPTWPLPDGGAHSFRDELARWRADPAGYVPPLPEGESRG